MNKKTKYIEFEKDTKTAMVTIRFTEEEFEEIRELAYKLASGNISQLLRILVKRFVASEK